MGRKFLVKAFLLLALPVGLFSQTIPYDPSLALANIVQPEKFDILKQLALENQKIENKQEKLNMLILTERSLEMTLSEIKSMDLSEKDATTMAPAIKNVEDQITKVKGDITAAAVELATARIAGYTEIDKIKTNLQGVISVNYESPVDYNKTQLKTIPLSADSIKMNAQYFSFGENEQNSNSAIKSIKAFISGETSFLGSSKSAEAATAATQQVSKQVENHSVLGTLVITGSCTHKNAIVLAPCVIDVDKAITVWNKMPFKTKINPWDRGSMAAIAKQQNSAEEEAMNILSGATYGSSFIGMVHLIKTENTTTSQSMSSIESTLQARMNTGGWFARASGGFGVDSQFASDVKDMLSTQSISSNVTMYSIGTIPVIKSNEVQLGVKQIADFDPAKMMEKLAALANSTSAAQNSMQEGANSARTGGQMMAIRNSEIKGVMSGLSEIDDGRNKILDINSLMVAFEDFAKKASDGAMGVPITYYLKPITASQLAQMWVAKYYPDTYVTTSAGDKGEGK